MSRRLAAICFFALVALPLAASERPMIDVQAQGEIAYLLTFVESAGCEFYRNGSWYEGRRARSHLQSKYDYLAARGEIHSAEDFIDKAATQSSLSNRPYQVRCAGGVPVPSRLWLRGVLSAYRAQKVDQHRKEGL